MAYSDITSAETDPESPLTTTLMVKYVDNLLQVEQWIKDRLDDMVLSNWTLQASGAAGGSFLEDVWYDPTAKRWVITGWDSLTRWSDDDGLTWTAASANPWGGNNDILGVFHDGSGLWVAVGEDDGNLGAASSPDGDIWTMRDANLTGAIAHAVVHDLSGVWVLVGSAGDVSTSPDGFTWTAQNSGVATILYGVCYGNSLFVAVGAAGVILTSDDGGVTWVPRVSGFGALDIRDVHYGNGLFVAVGEDGKFSTSTDGITWSVDDSGVGAGNDLWGVHYDSERWVAVADNGDVISSATGLVWTKRPTVVTANNLWSVARNGAPCWMVVAEGPILFTSMCDPNRQVIP